VAPPAGTLRVGRYFLALAILFIVLFTIVLWPGTDHSPKLGLDLRGGAQVIYKAQTTTGKAPSSSSMQQAKSIIDQRVNGLGVEQSQVVIQGSDEIVVTVPGKRADQLANVGATALLNFRPLIAGGFTVTAATPTASATASGSASTSPSVTPSASGGSGGGSGGGTGGSSPSGAVSQAPSTGAVGQNAGDRPLAAGATTPAASTTPSATPATTPSTTPSATGSGTPAVTPSATGSATALTPASTSCPTTATTATDADNSAIAGLDSTAIGYTTLCIQQQLAIAAYKCGGAVSQNPKDNVVVCDQGNTTKYLLGPVLVPGTEVDTASAQAPNASSGSFQWTVLIQLKAGGQKTWSEYTAAHHNADSTGQSQDTVPANYVAFTLDDAVISTPTDILGTINGNTQVSGSFTQKQANDLANDLKYGALPLKFTTETTSTVSATLGSAQLKAGLLAGGIGLILVVIYSLIYYRALGLVTIASLLVSGGLTYASLVVLGSQIGFTLTLAGIAGFIVAVGITADSFVVLFERIKDEVHEGRTMRVAIPRAWIRARRTIISADVVSFLAAAVLYEFAAGDVRGFAFTLGMSTILDLVVVFLFTHPLVSLLSRSAAFGSARFTGLNSVREGGVAQSAPTAQERRRAVANRRVRSRGGAEADTAVLDDEFVDGDPVEEWEAGPELVLDEGAAAANGRAAEVPTGGEVVEPDDDGPPAPKVRTTPAPGTAAERAAARRARLREKKDV
jgi:preprotein translocase subunit SecD